MAAKTKTQKTTDRPKMGLVDSAIKAMKGRTKPISAGDLYDLVVAKGLWEPKEGKTPVNTLRAAISVEIAKLGKKARFARHKDGGFVLTSAGAASDAATGNGEAPTKKGKGKKPAKKVKAPKAAAADTAAPDQDEGFHAGDAAAAE